MSSPCICSPLYIVPYGLKQTTGTGQDTKRKIMDFELYWTLIGGDVNFSDRKAAAERAWNLCAPDKQLAIITWLRAHGKYPSRNPYFFILDFQAKKRQILSYADYYARFGTTEERDGWKMENPTGNKVIYVKF